MHFSERSTSLWRTDVAPLVTAQLRQNLEADVCVIGAGMAGLSVAYELSRVGQRVIVLDDNAAGGGETAQSAAQIASALDDRYFELERNHGERGAALAYESHAAAVERIEQIVREEQIECGFQRVDGYLFLTRGQSAELLACELAAAQRAGFREVQRLPRAPDAAFDTGPCLRFPRQAQFHPLRYLGGLLGAVQKRGGLVFTGTHVGEIREPHDGRPGWVATSQGFTVLASRLVVATNTPVNDRVAIHAKQAAYRTFVVALAVRRADVRPALYWDTGDPHHYVRFAHNADAPDAAWLLVGGENHRTGRADDAELRFERLTRWARERFPSAGPVGYRWSGQVMEPTDGLAFIGRNPGTSRQVFVATGDSGDGITHGAIAGMLIKDLLLGAANRWEALYDPARKNLKTLAELARNNSAVAVGYARWLAAGVSESEQEVPRGKGRIVRQRSRRLAVSRNEDGTLEVCTAACPHLGGLLQWNSLERSWDCPLHGSRFAPNGQVLNGPALHGLGRLSLGARRPRRSSVELAAAQRPKR